jgi:hypothetical protein
MKTYFLATMLVVSLGFSVAAQSPPRGTGNFTTPPAPSKPRHRPAPPVSQKAVVDGVIPRAVRNGNPLQMLNPNAPRRYGTSQEAVTYDPDDPYKWKGIKFFEIRF